MERSFVLVLTFVSLVTTTPHGYGTKGGASAKAEARAVAGTFGDLGPIPLSIPSGAGYSGSFSKSSSSSFASSSASASASSYSFSGSGVNSIGTGKGCQSGSCPGTGTTGPSSNGLPHVGGANAFAAADAKAVSGSYSPCQGSNCSDRKCISGQCSTDLDHAEKKNGCNSGTCQSESDKETSPSDIRSGSDCSSGQCDKDKNEGDDDSNDYAVNVNRNSQIKPSLGFSGQYSNNGAAYNSGPTSCSNGKCSSTVSHPSHEGNNQNQQSPPATYLTTPNEHPPCTTPNCNQHSHGYDPETGALPSSYNVPIQSATNPPNPQYSPSVSSFEPVSNSYPVEESQKTNGAPCTSPGCSSYNSGTSITPNYNFGQQEESSKGLCVSGQCGSGATSGVISPNYSHGNSQSQIPSGLSEQPCNTPNCAEIPPGHTNFGSAPGHKSTIPAYSNLPSNQPDRSCGGTSCSSAAYSGSPTKPVESDAPTYTGGFGGPAGFLDTAPVSTKLPGHAGNHYGSSYTPGSSGSTGAFGSTPQDGSYGITKPNKRPASHYEPTHTAGSYHASETGTYGSAPIHNTYGTTKPNQYSTSGPTGDYGFTPTHGYFATNKPHDYNSNGITQTSSNGGSTISGYTQPDGLLSTPGTQSHSLSGLSSSTEYPFVPVGSSTSYPENNGIPKPSTTDHNTAYNNGNYGSAGSSNTNTGYNSIPGSYGTKPSATPSAQSNPTYTGGFGGPTGTTDTTSSTNLTPGAGNCGSAGCNGQHNDNGGTTSYGATKPGMGDSSENKPAYNGGFGGPTGFLKPNDFSLPTNTPDSQSEHKPCTNGNCGPKNNHSGNQGHGNSFAGAHSLSSATANANAVAYSGGFGGPPGVLKPYDDGKVNNPVQGNQGSEYNPSNAGHSGSPSVNGKNSTPGSTGNGNGAHIGAHASASASANAGTYNGGNYQNNSGGSGGCNSGCSSNGDGVNNGFPDGLVKNGIRAGSVASAKSIAGANAFGFGSSFASSSASAHASAGTKGGYGKK